MKLQQLIDYIGMDRWGDPAYRAYDLLHRCGPYRVSKALRYVGYGHVEPAIALPQLAADLAARDVKCENLREVLCEWFVWQRLNDGELRQWPFRKNHAPDATYPSATG